MNDNFCKFTPKFMAIAANKAMQIPCATKQWNGHELPAQCSGSGTRLKLNVYAQQLSESSS